MSTTTSDYPYQLRHLLDQNCRPGEIKHLSDLLGVHYDTLPGSTRLLKLNGLVQRYVQQDQLQNLAGQLQEWKPSVRWPEAPVIELGSQDQSDGSIQDDGGEAVMQRFIDELVRSLPAVNNDDPEADGQLTNDLSKSAVETFQGLDQQRKGELLRLLYDAGLIVGRSPVIRLAGADLDHIDLGWQQLSEINLSGASLFRADLSLCNLRAAHLAGVNLQQATVKAYLTDADLTGSDLSEAQLSGVRLSGAKLSGAILRIAELSGADLSNADLTGADMTLANLSAANLTSADLSSARLDNANLTATNLQSATLDQVNMSGTAVDQKQLQQASSMKGAILIPRTSHAFG